uniref:Apolipoprotein A-Ib n=1 Tax=Nothobranchius furzeri TaxID=105023 RepID=A0A8C6PCL8_NOTFU
MKFVALVLLLAVGSQAASLQADAPSSLAHARAVADVYINQAKESAIKALDHLDDTTFQEHKAALTQHLNNMHEHLKALQARVSPVTDSVVGTLADATGDLRAAIASDIEALKTELEPKRAKLREVLQRHMEDYRTQLEPIIKEYSDKHNAEMDALRVKLEPIVAELRNKIDTNVEETKAALVPIVESVRTKVGERVENLRQLAAPYVEEYKEQLTKAYSQAQSGGDQIQALREKISPHFEEIKEKLAAISAWRLLGRSISAINATASHFVQQLHK